MTQLLRPLANDVLPSLLLTLTAPSPDWQYQERSLPLSKDSPSLCTMAKIALILLLSFIFLCLHSRAREAPRLTGELRVRSIAIEDTELSRQISLSLRNPLGRRFHRGHRMPTLPTIRLPSDCHHVPGPLRMYRLGPAIPFKNFLKIVGDSGLGMHGCLEAKKEKIKR